MNRIALFVLAILSTALPAAGVFSSPAKAAFPGTVNGKIVFVQTAGDADLKVALPGGSKAVSNLLSNTYDERTPAWSPDGTKVAFASDRLTPGQLEIYAMNADGSSITRLTTNAAMDTDPAWSPEGDRVVFASNRDGDFELYIVNLNNPQGTPQRVTENTATDEHPHWSVNGEIAFRSNQDGDPEIYLRNPDLVGNPQQVTHNTATDGWPNWSPDGTRLVFASDVGGSFDIYIAPLNDPTYRVDDNSAFDTRPVWSPNGKRILFMSDRTGPSRMFTMDTVSSTADASMFLDVDANDPDWQPMSPILKRIANLDFKAHGTYAIVKWDQTFESTKSEVWLWKGKKGTPGSTFRVKVQTAAVAKKHWEVKVTHLDPGTTYDELYIKAIEADGDSFERKSGPFTTLRRTVEVTFTGVNVIQDGDELSGDCGEFTAYFSVGAATKQLPGGYHTLCDGAIWDAPDTKITLVDVEADSLIVKVLTWDSDSGFGHRGDIEKAEGYRSIDVSARDFTVFGENYSKIGQSLLVQGCSGCPKVTWYYSYRVSHE